VKVEDVKRTEVPAKAKFGGRTSAIAEHVGRLVNKEVEGLCFEFEQDAEGAKEIKRIYAAFQNMKRKVPGLTVQKNDNRLYAYVVDAPPQTLKAAKVKK